MTRRTTSSHHYPSQFRAIDLYSGIGGWTLGLKMAGIETVASYEWWSAANETLDKNFGTETPITNIRMMDSDAIPSGVNVVVVSPPCTQFSFANRGGYGDIQEGLKDIAIFLEIVEKLEPEYWAMENVPRVKKILDQELAVDGALYRFRHLFSVLDTYDCSEFGLPQRRRRTIAGNFPLELFECYKGIIKPLTLGEVLDALRADPVVDPSYPSIKIARAKLTDEENEADLTDEERKINKAAKQYHTIYNKMAFPDRTDSVSRTITATCTRVSRESIIVEGEDGGYRRLSIRERAVLQGFPITYQFYGNSYSNRVKMIGNAIPPLLSYFIGCSMMGRPPESVDPRKGRNLSYLHISPREQPAEVRPETNARRYPVNRTFRFTIPNLRFGSGVRFELANNIDQNPAKWSVRYFFGTSKNILKIRLTEEFFGECIKALDTSVVDLLNEKGLSKLATTTGETLQGVWTHRISGINPFEILNLLGELAKNISAIASEGDKEKVSDLVLNLHSRASDGALKNRLSKKYIDNACHMIAGFVIGAWFNTNFTP